MVTPCKFKSCLAHHIDTALVAEMVDAHASGACEMIVQVRVLSGAPGKKVQNNLNFFYLHNKFLNINTYYIKRDISISRYLVKLYYNINHLRFNNEMLLNLFAINKLENIFLLKSLIINLII